MNIRGEAYLILRKVFFNNLFSDKLLQKRSKKIDDQSERTLLYQLVKGVVKMRKNLDFIASQYCHNYSHTDKKVKIILNIGFFQLIFLDSIPDHAVLAETVNLAKKEFGRKIADFVNAVLREYLRNKQIQYPSSPVDRISVYYSFPESLISKWIEKWGIENTENLCRYFNENPQICLRINIMATERKKLSDYFQRRNISTEISPYSQNILLSIQSSEILNDVAFSEGYFSIQDTSSALVVELLSPDHDESVLDMFAAPGGKTAYICESMHDSGEIVAIDKFPGKTKLMKKQFQRLQLSNISIVTNDAFQYGPIAPAFDKVLLDVPCSGWGVFQKKADLRWQNNQDIDELIKLQAKALKTGAAFVKKRGFLIYSTCTMNDDENEKQVEKFLSQNRNFRKIDAGKYLPKDVCNNGFLQTLPFIHRTDGAFAAKLQKVD